MYDSQRLLTPLGRKQVVLAELQMIKTYPRAANDDDLGAMSRGRGSFVRNILLTSLPLSAVLFGVAYWIWHSAWIPGGHFCG